MVRKNNDSRLLQHLLTSTALTTTGLKLVPPLTVSASNYVLEGLPMFWHGVTISEWLSLTKQARFGIIVAYEAEFAAL